ncbi:ABC transporter ATP-binding protein/permease [Acetobacter malorum]|uniref:ABC transporter ATP-binding protein/permease n=1 Tax=Acetobacter malorum TaxID=178901 RepID=UPI0039EA83BD
MNGQAVSGSSTFPQPPAALWQHFVQTTEKTPRHSLSDWKVILPYWLSEEKWRAFAMLGGIIGLSVIYVRTAVWFGKWNQSFFDAMFAFRVQDCLSLLPPYILVSALAAAIYVFQIYLTQVLSMRWRLWNTRVYLRQYLSNETYYRLEHGLEQADNPDQRIADDLSQMTIWTLKLGLDAIQAVTTLISFSIVLWDIGGTLSFTWHGHAVHIPGYLFLGTVLATLFTSLVLERFGGPLVGANYRQQHYDADLRAGLMDVRRNSEQIAFYGGEEAENLRFSRYLAHIATNWRSVVTYTWRANFITTFFHQTASCLLWVMLIPKLLAHTLTVGLYSRINAAFMQTRSSLQWFIDNYTDLATLRSILQRLNEFERIVGHPFEKGIVRQSLSSADVQIENLVLKRPDGSVLTTLPNLTMHAGERWMISGPSGVGKSTLLRALAGLWGFGSGTLSFDKHHTMFVPQRPYVPDGTALRQVLSYPATPEHYDTQAYESVLKSVNLARYIPRLDDVTDWSQIFSPGEEQRIAIARALLFRPRIVFLDEATSALDEENENLLYTVLTTELPHTTLVSVAHHGNLRRFHQHEILLSPKGALIQPIRETEAASGSATTSY